MIQRVLVTHARSVVALELVRQLHACGFEVHAADQLTFPITKSSNALHTYHKVPAPTQEPHAYIQKLIEIIRTHRIDHVIPCSQEVFYISYFKDQLAPLAQVHCQDFSSLEKFTDKRSFSGSIDTAHLSIPNSHLIDTREKLADYKVFCATHVFKPLNNTLSDFTLLCPNYRELSAIKPSKRNPWLAESFVEGREYCSYSFAKEGKLQSHVCYRPEYKRGLLSSIYIVAYEKHAVYEFVKDFVQQENYTGHLSISYIISPYGDVRLIEARPMVTAGIFLLQNTPWQKALNQQLEKPFDEVTIPRMATLRMLLTAYKHVFNRTFWSDMMLASDYVKEKNDLKPVFYRLVSSIEVLLRAMKCACLPQNLAARDYDWDKNKIKTSSERH